MKGEIARILKDEGYIWNYEVKTDGQFPVIEVKVKYSDAGVPVLTDLKRVSKPGLRRYVGAGEIPRVLNGLGISILSTSKGLKTGAHAKKEKLGGELLAYVW
jgi:small subunit ribosomal protein S8